MVYICKVFTPQFEALLAQYLEMRTWGLGGFNKEFAKHDIRSAMNLFWNNKDSISASLYEHYKEYGVHEPEYSVQEFEDQRRGLQNMPRIIWDGEVRKIDEINSIFSYERKFEMAA